MNCLELSVYHNTMAVGNFGNCSVFLWNYEFCKLSAEIKLDEPPAALHFVNGYSLLLVGCQSGLLRAFRVTMGNEAEVEEVGQLQTHRHISKICSDLMLEGTTKKRCCERCTVFISFDKGHYAEIEIECLLKEMTFLPHAK